MRKLSLLLVVFFCLTCKQVYHLADVETQNHVVKTGTNTTSDDQLNDLISPYKTKLDQAVNQVIGQSAITMVKARPQSTLGNWMADALHVKAEAYYGKPIDFSIVNYGGIRISELRKGPVTIGNIYELMPFENMIVVLKVKGDVVLQFFDHMASMNGWPISRQAKFKIRNGKAEQVGIKGSPVDPEKTYTIGISDYIANGGDRCFFFRDQPRDNLNVLLRDALLEFVEEETAAGKFLDAEMDHRVRVIEN